MSPAVKMHWFKDAKRKKMDIDFSALLARSPVVWHTHRKLPFICVCVCELKRLHHCVWVTLLMCEAECETSTYFLCDCLWILNLNTSQSVLSWKSISTPTHSSGTAGNLPIKPPRPPPPPPYSVLLSKTKCNSQHQPKGGALLLQCTSLTVLKRLSWTQQEEAGAGPIKRNYTKKRKKV